MKANGTSQKILSSAVEFLMEWEKSNMTLDSALDELRKEKALEKSAIASLLFEYFRHKGFIDGLIARHAKKSAVRQDMRLLLACAATQVFFQTGIAWQSAINIAVDYGKCLRGEGGGGFVNAMLRTFLRDQSFDHSNIPKSFPELLKKRWTAAFGAETYERLFALFASNPPLSFRMRNELPDADLNSFEATPLIGLDFTGDFRFFSAASPNRLFEGKYLENADLYIQDPATALPLSLIDFPLEGRILDACAAPGGKTIMFYDRFVLPAKEKNETERSAAAEDASLPLQGPRIALTATDRSPQRLAQMNINFRRAGVRARSIAADAQSLPFAPGAFDLVLADVPCSNSGVIRRRPDAPWRFSERRLNEVLILQRNILDALAKQVKQGAYLLYSTCSIEAEEDQDQTAAFLERHPEFELRKERLLLPSETHDGAFAALFRRNS